MVDRNVHKDWFDENMPPCLRTVRAKRYKTVDVLLHFFERFSKRRSITLKLFVLVRITDVEKLVEEVGKRVPHANKGIKGVFVYERCFAGSSGKSVKSVPESIRALEHISFHDSLETACQKAIEAMRSGAFNNENAC